MGKRRKSKHHLVPRSRGGTNLPNNTILLNIEKHQCWHTLFGNLTLDEVIELLIRIRNIKRAKEVQNEGKGKVEKGKGS